MTTPRQPMRRTDLARLVATAAAIVGFGVAVIAIVPRGVLGDGGFGGGDAHAYWVAGRNVLSGAELYGAASGDQDAYLYPPPFAQALALVAGALPAAAFVWLWRLVSVGALIYAAGGWRAAGIALLVFPPAIVELDTANVHFVLAAICAMVIRGHTGALPFAFVLKLAGGGVVPFALHRSWRGLIIGGAGAAVVVLVSIALAPHLWGEYVAFLSTAQPTDYWTNLTRDIPLIPRLALAAGIGALAIRWVALVPVAFVLSMPLISLNSLAILVAIAPFVPAIFTRSARSIVGRGPRASSAIPTTEQSAAGS